MNLNRLKQPKVTSWVVLGVMILSVVFLSGFEYRMVDSSQQSAAVPTLVPGPTIASSPATASPTPLGQGNGPILGIDSGPQLSYPGIPWVRISYATCGGGDMLGDVLKSTIQTYHQQGVRVLLLMCQSSSGPQLFNVPPINDVAHAGADAVECGNEQMKYDPPATLYISPQNFARYYDLCASAVHAVNPKTPVLMGSLDPHVGGVDFQPLMDQVKYLNQMQSAMNTAVHPGGHWKWQEQTIGLIDSWHNGYPDDSVNSLYHLYQFWAQQFHVNLSSGQLGKHLWVIEGTGCFQGCGLDPNNAYQIAVSHILTLITDVRTTMRYQVPFFYFSSQDFVLHDVYWPIGILDTHGQPKPLRQDLSPGARKLVMTCSTGKQTVVDQRQLLAALYKGCSLPANYVSILVS